MQPDARYNQKETAARFARQSILEAKPLLREGNLGGFARKLESAVCWAVEAWLREHDHRPNFRNGWSSMMMQFMQLAPDELRRAVLNRYSATAIFAAQAERIAPVPRPDRRILSDLEGWCDSTAAMVESLIAPPGR